MKLWKGIKMKKDKANEINDNEKQVETDENSVEADEASVEPESNKSEPNKFKAKTEPNKPESKDETITRLKKELETAKEEGLEKLQRSMAEFDNYRKRTLKEKAGMYDEGIKDAAVKMLPVLDNLERALISKDTDETQNSALYKGVDMIFKQFKSVFEELGVSEIETVGQTFNPELHFAVSHGNDDTYGENEIAEELQKGYMYKDRVIRASMVKVMN